MAGLYDNFKKDVEKDIKATEEKLNTTEGRRWVKYAAYATVALMLLVFASCMAQLIFRPLRPTALDYTQPIQQPVVVQQGSSVNPLLAAGAGALAGYVVGQSRMPDGSIYQGTPAQRTIIQRTVIINKPVAAPVPTTATVGAPVIAAPAAVKVKNPGDAAAEQARKQDALKAELKAKQAARAAAPSKPSGFSSFSKSVSSRSSGGRR